MVDITINDINGYNREQLKECMALLTEDLSRLTELMQAAVEKLDDLDDASFEPEEPELAVGDLVKILNNHKGLKGKIAQVQKVTDYYV